MRRRPLGRTGLNVSELTLGTWGLSGDAYGPVLDAEVDRVLDRAIDLGITTFETADAYALGAMEAKLGARLPPGVTIVTRIGTDRGVEPPKRRFDPTYLRIAFERCQERQRRDALDVVLLHNPAMSTLDGCQATNFLRELQTRSLVHAWGVSAGSVAVAREAVHQGADVVELPYNIFCSADLHELAGELSEAGVGVLARSVLAHGLLTGHWSAEREFYPGDHRKDRWTPNELRGRVEQLEAIRPLVTGSVASLRSAALRFVLSNDLVSSAVIGPRSVAQLDQLVREAGSGPPYLRDTSLAELSTRLLNVGVIL